MNRTEKILNSLDGLKRAETSDWFYAGIRAKMAANESAPGVSWFLRPAFVISMSLVFLALNLSLLTGQRETQNEPSSGIASFAQQYDLQSGGSLQTY